MSSDKGALPPVDGPIWEIIGALPVAIYTTDADGFITFFNQAAADLAGRTPKVGRDRWCVTWRLYSSDGQPLAHELCPMAVALKENRIVRGVAAIAVRPDGTRFSFMPFPTPIRDAAGAVSGGYNVLVDLTTRKAADLERKEFAADVEDRFAMVLHMVELSMQRAARPAHGSVAQGTVRQALHQALHPVAPVSATQAFLDDAAAGVRVSTWDLLSAASVAASSSIGGPIDLVCEATAGEFSAETAIPLGLIARELITNAVAHGASGRGRVRVRVGLRREGGDYILSVEDDGPGFSLPSAGVATYGLSLVLTLTRQLNGSFEVERTPGARCILRFPDPRVLH